ncbi:hypothetical protein ZWY2020_041639 [Hordeum vulgare]|nr:hypothetical protein ZWY2020_041639 [Hordeum vulgare]
MATRATPPSAIPHLEICRRTTARRQSHASSSILLRGAKLRRPIFIPVPPVALPSASSSSFHRRLACVVPAHLPARRQCLPRRGMFDQRSAAVYVEGDIETRVYNDDINNLVKIVPEICVRFDGKLI